MHFASDCKVILCSLHVHNHSLCWPGHTAGLYIATFRVRLLENNIPNAFKVIELACKLFGESHCYPKISFQLFRLICLNDKHLEWIQCFCFYTTMVRCQVSSKLSSSNLILYLNIVWESFIMPPKNNRPMMKACRSVSDFDWLSKILL